MCSLGIEPTTFALLTQCSTTEPQEHVWGFMLLVKTLLCETKVLMWTVNFSVMLQTDSRGPVRHFKHGVCQKFLTYYLYVLKYYAFHILTEFNIFDLSFRGHTFFQNWCSENQCAIKINSVLQLREDKLPFRRKLTSPNSESTTCPLLLFSGPVCVIISFFQPVFWSHLMACDYLWSLHRVWR